MNDKKKTTNTTSKPPLLNDCTNHLTVQLKGSYTETKSQQKYINSTYETPEGDDVTYEFVRGYN